jgi:hypothetical protein
VANLGSLVEGTMKLFLSSGFGTSKINEMKFTLSRLMYSYQGKMTPVPKPEGKRLLCKRDRSEDMKTNGMIIVSSS